MARKTENYTVTDEGRDKGKLFVITEMSARRAESWATRVLLALIANHVEMPEGFEELGLAGLAELGMQALSDLKWEVVEPLLAEMLECVSFIPDPRKMHVSRGLVESDIEEVLTLLTLRVEVWKIHTDFLEAVAPSLLERKRKATAGAARAIRTSRR